MRFPFSWKTDDLEEDNAKYIKDKETQWLLVVVDMVHQAKQRNISTGDLNWAVKGYKSAYTAAQIVTSQSQQRACAGLILQK